MAPPTGRVFALLELLQAAPGATATELAGRLSVDERTVRRYATHLSELGIPVLARRGRHGGFRLAAGFRPPPLMLTSEEAVAVALALGLARAGRLGSADTDAATGTALAKVRRLLPAAASVRLGELFAAHGIDDEPQEATPRP